MPKFYRVENKVTQEGPYKSGVVGAILDEGGFDYTNHPAPRSFDEDENIKKKITSSHFFGFSSMKMAKWWWDRGTTELETLNEFGFVLSVYEVDEILEGRFQSAAKIGRYEPIAQLDLRTCFK